MSVSFPVRQVAIAALLAVGALVVVSFARVLIAEYQLDLQKQALETDVSQLKQENQQLKAKIDYLQTDQAIEGLAREELGWTKPGDTAVVVLRKASSEPAITPVKPSVLPPAETPWQRWWRALIGRTEAILSQR